MRQCALVTEPPYTERYVRWCERTASQIMGGLLLDLTLGFVLILTLSSPTEEAKEDKIKSNTKPKVKTPPVSAEKHRRASPGVTTSRFAQIRKTLIWLPGPLGEGAFKSVNRNR